MSTEEQQHHGIIQDTDQPLGQVRRRIAPSGSLVSAVLAVQRHAVTRDNWIKSLECLSPAQHGRHHHQHQHHHELGEPSGKRRRGTDGSSIASSPPVTLLRRTYLNPVSDSLGGRDYVAVSYTWGCSPHERAADGGAADGGAAGEDAAVGGYHIEPTRAGDPARPCKVRDVVWERVLRFSKHVKCPNIWIDGDCIDQEDEAQKEVAIQNMHLVYSLSRKPVALLSRVIRTADEIDLLVSLLLGHVRPTEEAPLLELLDDITSDLWWNRAWTFQEDYRASTRMTLMIPHEVTLEHCKRASRDFRDCLLFGTLPGELCIKSTEFRYHATQFCLSYRRKNTAAAPTCDNILRRAGKYNVLLREEYSPGPHAICRSMSPTIFADIGRRDITHASDRLAIAANCCGYLTRLNAAALNRERCSLSLSLLALFLLNGEIVENDPRRRRRGSRPARHDDEEDVYTYLVRQSLASFRPPVENEELTFIKSCRLVDPHLTPEGTLTRGHLWRLGKVIRSPRAEQGRGQGRERGRGRGLGGRSGGWGRGRGAKFSTLTPLETLADDLQYRTYGKSYTSLATCLLAWAHESAAAAAASADKGAGRDGAGGGGRPRGRPWEWREWMADEVEAALVAGKALRLASLVTRPDLAADGEEEEEHSPYSAIFVGDGEDDWGEEDSSTPPPASASSQDASVAGKGGEGKEEEEEEEEEEAAEQKEEEEEDDDDEEEDSTSQDLLHHVSLEVDVEWPTTAAAAGDEPPAATAAAPRLLVRRWINGLCFFEGEPQRRVLFPWPPALLAQGGGDGGGGGGPP
ncbi:heterokaryon incompatibility protein-domain-containing protein [Xylariaceae sp. FL0804]|nr:heterokaryon incompatibility protein-domain-containing protein [Xylariaceae sp. FL0804]